MKQNTKTWVVGIGLAVGLALIILLALGYFIGTSNESYMMDGGVAMSETRMSAPMAMDAMAEESFISSKMIAPQPANGFASDSTERLIIRNGNLSVVVKNVEQTIKEIENQAKALNGFVIDSSINYNDDQPFGNIQIRIPSDQLDAVIEQISSTAVRVVSRNISGQDFTQEFVDNDARLNQELALEKQLLELLSKSKDVNDTLQIYNQLNNIRYQIESLQARQKFLKESEAMSSLYVSVALDEASLPIVAQKDQWRPLVVVREAWRGTISLLKGLGNFIIWIIVLGVVWVPVLLVIWWFVKKQKG